ncbi:DUF2790 domain-containing protein [Pseudomonas alkylphenolica]|uniref:DUF2790 domain-containing protein n=1 Tax=Pseudomonas alkylphenolica TaxID=237609 RepID=A0A443ZR39_9PSED|nr:DUF2790 domain-containing protein [Pseudomonas alkylphenolica]RWU21560.1 DUF2790 domain-containing protein [Pseudomonas alkylphenolica]
MKSTHGLLVAAQVLLATPGALAAAPSMTDPRLLAHAQAVQAYAARNGTAVPTIEDYHYGAAPDVARLVAQTPMAPGCEAAPMLMTYESSSGQLVTLRYALEGQCPRLQSAR